MDSLELNKQKKRFVAVAWPYVNGDIHVGHLAGYLVPCDIFARYSRLKGYETLMVSGTDCHGTPITVEADKRGISPKELIKEYEPKVHDLIKLYNVSYDLFTSTTTQNHAEVTREVFLNLLNNGYIIKKKSDQYYSEVENKFLPDRYVEGECPHCHSKDQRADQCESCGRTLGLGELINPLSKLSKTPVILKETEHYFIDFPKLEPKIKEYAQNSEHWRDWVAKETLGWLNEGLEPRAITRDIDWGVSIPQENLDEGQKLENAETKRFYVWFDAVIGYLSAAREWADTNGRDWKEFWIDPECKHYYFMGKDNLAFHTIFWPGEILGQQKDYNLPYFPCVNHFLNLEGKKFSKSRGVHINSIEVGNHFGVDQVRFYISSIMPETKDANWKWEEFRDTINSGLVGNVGNFVHRTLSFFNNKLEGKFQALPYQSLRSGTGLRKNQLDQEILGASQKVFEEVSSDLEGCRFVGALNKILKYSQLGNQYFDAQKPWASIKEDREVCEKTIYNCLQIVYSLRTLLNPFIPNASDDLSKLLGLEALKSDTNHSIDLVDQFVFEQLDCSRVEITKDLKPLFPKVEDEQIEAFQNL
jgi:methionyl-tRNA synthetase